MEMGGTVSPSHEAKIVQRLFVKQSIVQNFRQQLLFVNLLSILNFNR